MYRALAGTGGLVLWGHHSDLSVLTMLYLDNSTMLNGQPRSHLTLLVHHLLLLLLLLHGHPLLHHMLRYLLLGWHHSTRLAWHPLNHHGRASRSR